MQEPSQLPIGIPELIPATCDLPTADEYKDPATSSNTDKTKEAGEM